MNLEKGKSIIIISIIVFLIATISFILSLSDAPKKTVTAIRAAVKACDVAAFEKYVDLDNFFEKGFDSYINAAKKLDKDMNESSAEMAFMFKSMIVDELASGARRYIAAGGADGGLGESFGVGEELGVASWEFKSAGPSKRNGKNAVVPVKIYDRQVDKTFTFNIALSKTDKGVWRVKEIENAEELMIGRAKAVEDRLALLNAEVKEQIVKAMEISDVKLALKHSSNAFWSSNQLLVDFSAKNMTDRDIDTFSAKLAIRDPDGKTIYTLSDVGPRTNGNSGVAASARKQISSRGIFSPSADADKNLLQSGTEDKTGQVEVYYVKFSDGTALNTLRKLPPYVKQ